MADNFSFNPACKVLSIGKIESIHIHRGKGIFGEGKIGKITYTMSGFSLRPTEKDLMLYSVYEEIS